MGDDHGPATYIVFSLPILEFVLISVVRFADSPDRHKTSNGDHYDSLDYYV